MGKAAKGSRKGKKAWRANISTHDIDDYFDKSTKDALTGRAATIASLPSDSLFYLDTKSNAGALLLPQGFGSSSFYVKIRPRCWILVPSLPFPCFRQCHRTSGARWMKTSIQDIVSHCFLWLFASEIIHTVAPSSFHLMIWLSNIIACTIWALNNYLVCIVLSSGNFICGYSFFGLSVILWLIM